MVDFNCMELHLFAYNYVICVADELESILDINNDEYCADVMVPLLKVAGIKAYGRQGLNSLMEAWGEPRFRAGQIEKWLYANTAISFNDMTNLPASLRTRLSDELTLPYPNIIRRDISTDGTRKYILAVADNAYIETVGLPSGNKLTVCISTQSGCAMGCVFCATGKEGLTRSLAPGEIVDQVTLVAADFGVRVSNVVTMGQGESFANYDALLSALRFMNSSQTLNIGARHITVSSCGLLPMIRRFSTEPEQFTLAISLHSAIQETRDSLMPAVSRYSLSQLRSSLQSYTMKTGRRVSLEYSLIKQVNDSLDDLQALISFCEGLLCHVNLIPLNAIEGSKLKPSDSDKYNEFSIALNRKGIETTIRRSRGTDISGACGQLKAKHLID